MGKSSFKQLMFLICGASPIHSGRLWSFIWLPWPTFGGLLWPFGAPFVAFGGPLGRLRDPWDAFGGHFGGPHIIDACTSGISGHHLWIPTPPTPLNFSHITQQKAQFASFGLLTLCVFASSSLSANLTFASFGLCVF